MQGFLDGSKYKSARVNISYRNSKKVIIDSIEDVPESFLKIKVEPDKRMLANALKSEDVSGAHIEESVSMTIK